MASGSFDWIHEFIGQANSGDLKFAQYPKEYGGYKMKVSFGQGVPARVPWISFLPEGMSTSNGFYPVYLYYKEQNILILAFGVSETFNYGKTWREETIGDAKFINEIIDSPPRYGESWAYKCYSVSPSSSGYDLTLDGKAVSDAEIETDLKSILALFSENIEQQSTDKDLPVSAGLFYMEKQLEDFLILNWNNSELGKKYELLYADGELVSQQYRTSIGPIDILTKDKETGNYVVIELKRAQTSDDTIGQVTRYMGWVKENLNDPGVKGIIIAGRYDEKLQYAQSMVANVDVYLYQVEFSLSEHRKK